MAATLCPSWDCNAPYLTQAVTNLKTWPSLTVTPARNGVSFITSGQKILHLSGGNPAHLHLTQPMIDRLDPTLRHYRQVGPSADHGWVSIRVESSSDLRLLLTLISLAIKANT
ncbi:luciferase family protein [Nonomuraea roseoviolacea]|uniref:luciferase domain-containing protein n=1 Tax=Nonomuraea roseoviolacea TaxID=103837 RepID=UPI0031D6A0B7